MEGNDISLITTVFPIDIHLKTNVFRKTDHEYPLFAHPALVLKRDFEKKRDCRRSQVSILDFIERTCVGLFFFLLDRAEPLYCERTGGNFPRVTVPVTCCMFHRSLSAVFL